MTYSTEIISDMDADLPEWANGYSASSYTTSVSTTDDTIKVTVTHLADLGNITTSIQWIDDDDNDGQRPEQVTVQLYADDTAIGDPVILSADNSWSYEWTNLNIFTEDAEGQLTEYSVKVISDIGDYLDVYTPTLTYVTENQNLLITLTDKTDVLNRTVTIHWDDSSNRDAVRPETVTVTLIGYQWNEAENKWEDVTYGVADVTGSTSEDDWTYTFEALPIFHDGYAIIYRAEVSSDLNALIPATLNQYTDVTNEMDIVISRITDTGTITTSIQWVDNDDNDAERPEQVRVQLYADGVEYGAPVVLNADNNWSYEWNGLDIHVANKEGTDIIYNVVVIDEDAEMLDEVGSYDIVYTPETTVVEDEQNLLITITDDTDLDSYTVTVYWNDASDRDGLRPESIVVVLYKDGEPYLVDGNLVYGTVTAQDGDADGDTWTYTFDGLEVMSDGTQAVYSAVVYDIDAINNLIASKYNVEDAYSVSYSALQITMNHESERGTITTSIQWVDDDNNDNQRPEQVEVQLYADGEPYGDTVILNAANGWSYEWYNLYTYTDDGTKTEYSVKVVSDIGDYTDAYTPAFTYTTENQNLLITLTDETDTTTKTVAIHWDDSSNRDGVRPSTVTVSLYGYQYNETTGLWDTEVYKQDYTFDGDVTEDIWTYTFNDLPVYNDSKEIIYRAEITSDLNALIPSTLNQYTDVTNEMDIVVSRITDTGTITTSIQWVDENDTDGQRPEQVFVQLYADGKAYGNPVTLNAENGWSYEWDDLDIHTVNLEGVDTVYYVKIVDEDTAYLEAVGPYSIVYTPETTVIEDAQNLLITVTDDPDVTSRTIEVTWDDESNRDGQRPSSITVGLYATQYNADTNVTETVLVDTAVITDSASKDEWTYTFDNLPVYHDGYSIIYSTEIISDMNADLPEWANGYSASSYTTSVSTTDDTIKVTVTHLADLGNITTSIQWIDDDDNDGQRPEQVVVQLYADDDAIGDPVTLSADNNWSYVCPFTDVPEAYSDAAAWAYENGITNGESDTELGTECITEECFVTMLLRCMGYGDDFAWYEAAEYAEDALGLAPIGLSPTFCLGDAALYIQDAMNLCLYNSDILLSSVMNVSDDIQQISFPYKIALYPDSVEAADKEIKAAAAYVPTVIEVYSDNLADGELMAICDEYAYYQYIYRSGEYDREIWYAPIVGNMASVKPNYLAGISSKSDEPEAAAYRECVAELMEQQQSGEITDAEYYYLETMANAEYLGSDTKITFRVNWDITWRLACDVDDAFTGYADDTLSVLADEFYQECMEEAKSNSAYDIVMAAKNVIVKRASYTYPLHTTDGVAYYASDAHNICGFLEDGQIVCDGYSSAFMYIMARAGIPCVEILGSTIFSEMPEKTDHSWCKVKIDDAWYNIDICWADTDHLYKYDLKSDETYGRMTHWASVFDTGVYEAKSSYSM